MESSLRGRAAALDSLLDAWTHAEPDSVLELITPDYQGHMLYLDAGERTAAEYPSWIRAYREANPGIRFTVEDQGVSGDRLWTRLRASRPDGGTAHGINVSRFDGDLVAEEWPVWSPWLP
jgi:hypothetical protein